MSKLNIGFCGIDETQIFDKKGTALVANKNYCEITLALSDGSIARHGICTKCVNNLTDKKIQALIGRIKETWSDSMAGWASDTQFDNMKDLTVKAYHQDEEVTVQKYKVVKEKEFKDHLVEVKIQKDIAIALDEALES